MKAPRTRVQRRPVHGVLLLDKPKGLSSNDALQKCKWLLRAEKGGHTGTLDPLATGVLPLCFGAATKFSQLHLEADKTYEAVAVLGVKTSTGDAEGQVVAERPVWGISAEQLGAVQRQFTGRIRQLPPMHSALKKDGKALYEYARAGEEVAREPRDVTIHALELSLAEDAGRPAVRLIARVSKGTYIRTLGEEIGEALGCGAHLSLLRRTATGPFGVARCVTLEAFEASDEDEREAALLPPEALLEGHSRVTLDAEDAGRFLSGLRRRGAWPDMSAVAVFGRNPPALLGTAHVRAGELIPGRLLSPIEIQQILQSPTATTTP
ncbi:tRNA pseudouridine(55) synthase TruB [Ramlibacter henchirensis]|uniref:tRNA pseudouridine synthase B n=1 Tax=Ramlibacter henchirensis TaxID=204072 RepID=A0A4Z0BSA1_9BURK|nr:tRNA pseudouridine(55) synthase TruB [Ramlibacter henchirensis]TFZ00879.1 tRNA pseudouridine(55) synthase TruB [Ramlibacter henchirensis]